MAYQAKASIPSLPSAQLSLSNELRRAFQDASKQRLETILNEICLESPIVKAQVARKILIAENLVPEESSSISEDVHSEHDFSERDTSEESESDDMLPAPKPKPKPETTGSKRLRSRFVECIKCEEEFDVLLNHKEACAYHPTYPQPDSDAFADDDAYSYGIGVWDEKGMFKKYPENFTFECCNRTGEEEPCTKDWHSESTSKKRHV